MNRDNGQAQGSKPRILLYSHKNLYNPWVWRCPFREFERIVQEVDSVEVVAPKAGKWYSQKRRLALRLGEIAPIPLNPGIPETQITGEYDMFVTVCERASELLHLKSLKGIREHCKTTVCWLPEFYVKDIPVFKSAMKILSEFDYVFFMYVANEPFKAAIRGQGQYLPAGIDTLNFCPYPNPPARSIDVLSIGRRAPAIHQALLKTASRDGKFYVYDTIDSLDGYNLDEHRSMIANMAKRSRYFMVSPGKWDRPDETGGQCEFGYRYFEAAAAGTIMIGMRPWNNNEFDKIFTWDDAVLEVPFDSDEIVSVIRNFDQQPERQQKLRQKNITECLLHHDWVYRWESILNTVGMQPLPALEERKRRLQELAWTVDDECARSVPAAAAR